MDSHRLGWLACAWFEGFGARSLRKLRGGFAADGSRAFGASRDEILRLGVTEFMTDRFIAWRNGVDPEMFGRRLEAEGIRFVLQGDDEYPSYLTHSSDPPAALFIRGAPLALVKPIAVVGTRSMTHYGKRVTDELCSQLVRGGCEIISGMALGIDAEAHEETLRAHGKTVAVLGGGCNDDSLYPKQNAPLGQRILDQGGTIVSEFPPGTECLKHHFPLRNRIIASLSVATVVVEAAQKSGSLITAKLALEENRDVFAVPGPITSPQSEGTNHLLSFGAALCTGADDVLRLFDGGAPLVGSPHTVGAHGDAPSVSVGRSEGKGASPCAPTEDEQMLLEILDRPLHLDEIIRALERPVQEVVATLATLELKGIIVDEGGKVYAKS